MGNIHRVADARLYTMTYYLLGSVLSAGLALALISNGLTKTEVPVPDLLQLVRSLTTSEKTRVEVFIAGIIAERSREDKRQLTGIFEAEAVRIAEIIASLRITADTDTVDQRVEHRENPPKNEHPASRNGPDVPEMIEPSQTEASADYQTVVSKSAPAQIISANKQFQSDESPSDRDGKDVPAIVEPTPVEASLNQPVGAPMLIDSAGRHSRGSERGATRLSHSKARSQTSASSAEEPPAKARSETPYKYFLTGPRRLHAPEG